MQREMRSGLSSSFHRSREGHEIVAADESESEITKELGCCPLVEHYNQIASIAQTQQEQVARACFLSTWREHSVHLLN